MAAGALLEAEIVTADGSVLIANSCSNPDLFWAIKGGGGGSFGVVTKITLRTRELPAFFGRVIVTIKACQSMAELRKVAPDAGSYVSESNFFDRSCSGGRTTRDCRA